MAKFEDLDDVTISNPKVGDVVKYTATGWQNGADAVSGGPDGNACGNLDEYLRSDREETIAEKWTWENAGCPSIEVKDTGTNESTEICPDKLVVKGTGISGTLGLDGSNVELFSTGQLKFKDSQNTTAVSLTELVACCDDGIEEAPIDGKKYARQNADWTVLTDSTGDGTSNGFAPIILQFEIDESASNKTGATRWVLGSDGASATIGYSSEDWGSNYGSNPARDVIVSVPRTITMPSGANGALVVHQTTTEMGVPGFSGLSSGQTERALAVGHKLRIDGVTFPIAGVGRQSIFAFDKGIVIIPGNSDSVVQNYRHKKHITKFDLINFDDGASATFTTKVDITKGGRGEIQTTSGRVVIFPFYKDDPTEQILPASEGFDSGYFLDDAELDALYQEYGMLESPEQAALSSGLEYRDLMRRMIVALESRKAYPPSGGASEAEFNQQIQNLWDLTENASLLTDKAFEEALVVIHTEISKPKYGIAFLFQFEQEAGVTTRGVL